MAEILKKKVESVDKDVMEVVALNENLFWEFCPIFRIYPPWTKKFEIKTFVGLQYSLRSEQLVHIHIERGF